MKPGPLLIWEESRDNEREGDLVVSLLSRDVSQVSEVRAKVKVGPARLDYVIVEEALPMELGRVRPFAGTGLGDIPTSRLDLMSVYLHSPPDGSITS